LAGTGRAAESASATYDAALARRVGRRCARHASVRAGGAQDGPGR